MELCGCFSHPHLSPHNKHHKSRNFCSVHLYTHLLKIAYDIFKIAICIHAGLQLGCSHRSHARIFRVMKEKMLNAPRRDPSSHKVRNMLLFPSIDIHCTIFATSVLHVQPPPCIFAAASIYKSGGGFLPLHQQTRWNAFTL